METENQQNNQQSQNPFNLTNEQVQQINEYLGRDFLPKKLAGTEVYKTVKNSVILEVAGIISALAMYGILAITIRLIFTVGIVGFFIFMFVRDYKYLKYLERNYITIQPPKPKEQRMF